MEEVAPLIPIAAGMAATGAVILLKIRKACKKAYPDNPESFKRCVRLKKEVYNRGKVKAKNQGKVAEAVIKEEAIKYSGSKITKLANQYGKAIEKKGRAGCEKWSVKAPFKGQEYRDKMMSCKAKADIKGLQASATFAKKLSAHCKDKKCLKTIQSYLIDIKSEITNQQRYVK